MEPIIIAPKTEHTGTVIMLHGLGDTGAGWAGVGQMFASQLPSVKFIFPTATERPITVNMGMQMTGWFDITSLEEIHHREDIAGLKESMQLIEACVRDEQSRGINKIVVAGFSQGGAVALLMLRSRITLSGVVGLSTWLTMADEELLSAENKATPLWMAHGTADQVLGITQVKYVYGERSYEKLKAAGANVAFSKYAGMGHEARPEELEEFKAWLSKVLA